MATVQLAATEAAVEKVLRFGMRTKEKWMTEIVKKTEHYITKPGKKCNEATEKCINNNCRNIDLSHISKEQTLKNSSERKSAHLHHALS